MNHPMQVGERRGPMVMTAWEWPSGKQTWESWASLSGRTRFVKVGRGNYMRWADLESVMGMLDTDVVPERVWDGYIEFRSVPGLVSWADYDDEMDD